MTRRTAPSRQSVRNLAPSGQAESGWLATMRRVRIAVATVCSVVWAVSTLLLVRTLLAKDVVSYQSYEPSSRTTVARTLGTAPGLTKFVRTRTVLDDPRRLFKDDPEVGLTWSSYAAGPFADRMPRANDREWHLLGFRYYRVREAILYSEHGQIQRWDLGRVPPVARMHSSQDELVVPLAYPAATLGIFPALVASRAFRRRRRRRAGLCTRCGYDLRASSATCPECGAAVDAQGRL
jgi:hypothetical protein